MMLGISLLLAFSVPEGVCQSIETETILARDVAAVVPAFSQLPADFLIGYVPLSGAPRVLKGADLERLAKNRGVSLEELPDTCFARRTFVPGAEQIREAMQSALGPGERKIEIVSSGQSPAPTGELVFPRTGLQMPVGSTPQPEVTWRGYVRYSASGKFPIWARARITAPVTRVIATTDVPAGKPIAATQVRIETCEDFPLDETTARSLEEVTGYQAKNSLRTGAVIHRTQIEPIPDVTRGDVVKVEVFEGGAHLVMEGRAQTSGVKGSTILVRNLSSGKDFRAQVAGKGHVTINGGQ